MPNAIRTGSSRINHFDAHLDDGSSLVIVFHVQTPLTRDRSVEPYVTVRLDRPGSPSVSFDSHSPVARFTVGKDHCHFLIGDKAVQEDLAHAGGLR
jgi:hypothetical protein